MREEVSPWSQSLYLLETALVLTYWTDIVQCKCCSCITWRLGSPTNGDASQITNWDMLSILRKWYVGIQQPSRWKAFAILRASRHPSTASAIPPECNIQGEIWLLPRPMEWKSREKSTCGDEDRPWFVGWPLEEQDYSTERTWGKRPAHRIVQAFRCT